MRDEMQERQLHIIADVRFANHDVGGPGFHAIEQVAETEFQSAGRGRRRVGGMSRGKEGGATAPRRLHRQCDRRHRSIRRRQAGASKVAGWWALAHPLQCSEAHVAAHRSQLQTSNAEAARVSPLLPI